MCECGDRIGCGIKFDQVLEGRGDPFCTMVPVYFARNGKEVSAEKWYKCFNLFEGVVKFVNELCSWDQIIARL